MCGKETGGQPGSEAAKATRVGTVVSNVFEQVCQAAEPRSGARVPRGLAGLPTPFANIDKHTHGLFPGEFTAVTGGPCADVGAFASNVAAGVALWGARVLFAAPGMSADETALRMLCSLSGTRIAEMLRGELSEEGWAALADASNRLAATDLLICDDALLTSEGLRALAAGFLDGAGDGLVVADVGLMAQPGLDPALDWCRIAEGAVVALKRLARELGVPVLATLPWAPWTPRVGGFDGDAPRLVMESLPAVVRAAADTVLYIGTPAADDESCGRPNALTSKVVLAKHRSNCSASAMLAYLPEYLRFMDLVGDSPEGR